MDFSDPQVASQMRLIISEIARKEIESMRPAHRIGRVDSIDRTRSRCTVWYSGATEAVTVKMGSIQPSSVGQYVRVEGLANDRFVTDVYGPHYIRKYLWSGINIPDTALPNIGLTNTLDIPIVQSPRIKLDYQTRIKVTFTGRYALGTTAGGRLNGDIWYSTSPTPSAGVDTSGASVMTIRNDSGIAGNNGSQGGVVIADFLLPAGRYIFWGGARRINGGDPTDVINYAMLYVEDMGTE